MNPTTSNRALLRAWLASTVLLTAVTACSRSDRAETGSSQDQTGAATMPADTAMPADTQMPSDTQATGTDTAVSRTDTAKPEPVAQGATGRNAEPSAPVAAAAPVGPDTAVSGYQAMDQDTDTTPTAGDTASVAVGDSAEVGKAGERLDPESSEQASEDTLMAQTESDRIRPPEDSTETLGAVTTTDSVAANGDTAVSGSEQMARDTTTDLAQADTVAQVEVDTTTQVTDTSTQVAADTSATVQAQVDTTTLAQETDVAVDASTDTAVVVGDSTEAEVPAPDQAPAAAAGAATSGDMLTGAEAVAQMTREGKRCTVVEGEESEQDIRWDLAGSPATMNPCGTGTMTLPRIQTEK